MTSPQPCRTLLFVAYHFPPSAAVGGQRIVNFATGVRDFGWGPHVLTIPDAHVEAMDRGRLRDVEGIPIHKAAVLPTLLDVSVAVWMRVRRAIFKPQPTRAMAVPAAAARAASATPERPTVRSTLRRYVMSFLVLPDGNRGWCLPATIKAIRTIRRQRIQWIMTSCPPYSVHLVGLAVKTLTRRRWVADFRDPWMTTGSKRLYPTSAVSRWIEGRLERLVVEQADLVTFNVARLRDAYRQRYAWVRPDKFVFIPNGISVPAAWTTPAATRYERFTICYAGSLYVGRSPEPVFQAVSRLIAQGAVAPDAIRIKLIGECGYIDRVPAESVIRKYGLESVVEVLGPTSRREAFEAIRRSHLALLLAPNLPFQVPAKVYDYLAAGARILAIAEDGATADVIRETRSGCAFDPEDVDGMARFISAELASPAGAAQPAPLDRFDVRRITEDLLGHLCRVDTAAGAESVASCG